MRHISTADVIMFVFSLTDPQTLHELVPLKERIDKVIGKSAPCVLVGNKCDLAHMRCVSDEDASKVAQSLNCSYFEMSVAQSSRESIDTVFQAAVKLAVYSDKVAEEYGSDGKSVGQSVKSALKWLKRVHRRRSIMSPMFLYLSQESTPTL